MVQETSNAKSNTPQVKANTAATVDATKATDSQPKTNAAPRPEPGVTAQQLMALEHRLEQKMSKNSGGKTGLLWLVTIIALAGAGFGGYTAFMNQQKLTLMESNYVAVQSKIDSATNKIETSATLLEAAQSNNAALQQSYNTLTANDQNLAAKINELVTKQNDQDKTMAELTDTVKAYEARNPYSWLLSESYFLVNNASQKAVFDKDITAALLMLTQADNLISRIEDQEVVELRKAISKDIADLKNISTIDLRGMGLSLDRAYDNVDKLVLTGLSDPEKRAQFLAGETRQVDDNDYNNWQDNLISSANNFAARFIEIRRRDANAATEFLTPAQDLYLRENIKTRILLAKSALVHGDKEAMQANLNDAIKLIKTYFEPDSTYTVSTLETLNKLNDSQITIAVPEVLQSAQAFSLYANKHLLSNK